MCTCIYFLINRNKLIVIIKYSNFLHLGLEPSVLGIKIYEKLIEMFIWLISSLIYSRLPILDTPQGTRITANHAMVYRSISR